MKEREEKYMDRLDDLMNLLNDVEYNDWNLDDIDFSDIEDIDIED